ncbi:hypothetical protein SAMN03159512_02998 [Pseudomonas sp. NFR09]|nr:hypothetical protein SAMN03159512_02998 [Pseudomonas sp. NFR09]
MPYVRTLFVIEQPFGDAEIEGLFQLLALVRMRRSSFTPKNLDCRRAGSFVNLVFCCSVCYRSGYSWACPRCLTGPGGLSGAKSTLPFIVGMVLGNPVWLLVATLRLTALELQLSRFSLQSSGLELPSFYLSHGIYVEKNANQPRAPAHRSAGRGLLSGALLTLSNPKAVFIFGAVVTHAFDLIDLSVPEVCS